MTSYQLRRHPTYPNCFALQSAIKLLPIAHQPNPFFANDSTMKCSFKKCQLYSPYSKKNAVQYSAHIKLFRVVFSIHVCTVHVLASVNGDCSKPCLRIIAELVNRLFLVQDNENPLSCSRGEQNQCS